MRYLLLLFLLYSPCLALLNHYFKMSKTDVIGYNIVHVECGEGRRMNRRDGHLYDAFSSLGLGYAKACDIEALAAQCNTNSNCSGFNSNGFLKSCTAGCDLGCCYDVTNGVDLYIRKGFLPPSDWQEKIDQGRVLFANPEPHYCFLPEIANGYLGTVAMSASLFQSGLFNGKVKNDDACYYSLMRSSPSSLPILVWKHRKNSIAIADRRCGNVWRTDCERPGFRASDVQTSLSTGWSKRLDHWTSSLHQSNGETLPCLS